MIYEFAASQDLHGYDKPWAPGEGKNMFPLDINIDDSNYGHYFLMQTYPELEDFFSALTAARGQTVIMSCDTTGTQSGVSIGQMRIMYGDTALQILSPGSSESIPEDADFSTANLIIIYGSTTGATVKNVMIEAGETASNYQPYANICPPEGFNIWDPTAGEFVQVYAGYVNANTRELYLRPVYKEYAGEELVGPWMSSLDEYSEDATPTEGAFVIDFGGELTSFEITPFMLQTLLDSLGIRQHFTDGAGLLNKLMDQAQGRVRSEEELLQLSRPLNVIAIGDQLPAGLTFKPISKDVLPGLPGKFIR